MKQQSIYIFTISLVIFGCGGGGSSPSTPKNDIPVAQRINVELDEDSTIEIELQASDDDGQITSIAIANEPSYGAITLSDSIVSYTPNTNFFGTDTFSYTATDNQGAISNIATVTIDVNSVNDKPVFEQLGQVQIEENGLLVGKFFATNVDDDILTYTLSCDDGALFKFDKSSAQLSFNQSPDFELPVDLGGDNVYQLTIEVEDELEEQDSLDLTITVSDVSQLTAYTLFPSENSILGGNRVNTKVSGIIRDREDDDVTHADLKNPAIFVDGQQAVINLENLSWSVTVPVVEGEQSLTITLQNGNEYTEIIELPIVNRPSSGKLKVGSGSLVEYPTGQTLDSKRNISYVYDISTDEVFSVNLKNGDSSIISSANIGEGAELDSIWNLVFDDKRNLLYTFNINTSANMIVSIDPVTGVRNIVAYENAFNGGRFAWMHMLYDPRADRLIFADDLTKRFYGMSLSDGVVSELLLYQDVTEFELSGITMTFDSDENLIYFANDKAFQEYIFVINLETWKSSILGKSETKLTDLTIDKLNNRLLAIEKFRHGNIISFDLDSGDINRNVIEDEGWLIVEAEALSSTTDGRAIVFDRSIDVVLSVDLETKQSIIISKD